MAKSPEIQFMRKKVTNLTGRALDWAVAEVLKLRAPFSFDIRYRDIEGKMTRWEPTTNWHQTGALIDKFKMSMIFPSHILSGDPGWDVEIVGETDNSYTLIENRIDLQLAVCLAVVRHLHNKQTMLVPRSLMYPTL
jgi:hypothetical protein